MRTENSCCSPQGVPDLGIVANPMTIITMAPLSNTAGSMKSAVLFMVRREFTNVVVTVAFGGGLSWGANLISI